MGLREMFSPCIVENFIAEFCDRITAVRWYRQPKQSLGLVLTDQSKVELIASKVLRFNKPIEI
jgi:hypothetical protein